MAIKEFPFVYACMKCYKVSRIERSLDGFLYCPFCGTPSYYLNPDENIKDVLRNINQNVNKDDEEEEEEEEEDVQSIQNRIISSLVSTMQSNGLEVDDDIVEYVSILDSVEDNE